MSNLEIREFQTSIREFIKLKQLPSEVVRLALKEIFDEVTNEANEKILAELNNREKSEKEDIVND